MLYAAYFVYLALAIFEKPTKPYLLAPFWVTVTVEFICLALFIARFDDLLKYSPKRVGTILIFQIFPRAFIHSGKRVLAGRQTRLLRRDAGADSPGHRDLHGLARDRQRRRLRQVLAAPQAISGRQLPGEQVRINIIFCVIFFA